MAENGDKTKVIIFLGGLLQTIVIAWSWWIGAALVEAKTDIAALEANYSNIMNELSDIKVILRRHK